MATNLTDFIWNRFSQYYHENDTNKDVNGKGTFERFLSVFGLDLTNETLPKLENFINQLDPNTADDEFLTQIAWALGNPADILNDLDTYRNVLTQIISIYQIKGTKQSYILLFAILGLSVEIEEIFPPDNLYDSGLIYDDDDPDTATTYDFSGCELTCIPYKLTYENLPGKTTAPMTDEQIASLTQVIKDIIQPDGAILTSLQPTSNVVPRDFKYTNNSINQMWLLLTKQNGDTIEVIPLAPTDEYSGSLTMADVFRATLFTEFIPRDYRLTALTTDGDYDIVTQETSTSGVVVPDIDPSMELQRFDAIEVDYTTHENFVEDYGKADFTAEGPLTNIAITDSTILMPDLTSAIDSLTYTLEDLDTGITSDPTSTEQEVPLEKGDTYHDKMLKTHSYRLNITMTLAEDATDEQKDILSGRKLFVNSEEITTDVVISGGGLIWNYEAELDFPEDDYTFELKNPDYNFTFTSFLTNPAWNYWDPGNTSAVIDGLPVTIPELDYGVPSEYAGANALLVVAYQPDDPAYFNAANLDDMGDIEVWLNGSRVLADDITSIDRPDINGYSWLSQMYLTPPNFNWNVELRDPAPNTILDFTSGVTDLKEGVTGTISTLNSTIKFKFRKISPTLGTPNTMNIKLSTTLIMVVDYPNEYEGRSFVFTDATGTDHSGRFTNGEVNF